MSTFENGSPSRISDNPLPTLATLPSELRRLIVSHLAPQEPKDVRRGCKTDLKNANLAHSCLRECVPEFIFRDMALPHVMTGISTQLEYFAFTPANTDLLKYVKRIVVQVPPALCWDAHAVRAEPASAVTADHLFKKFGVTEGRGLSLAEQEYCENYHRALVEPFIESRRWYELRTNAEQSWAQILRKFPSLEEIAVGCCERVDHPYPTYTNSFITQHGPLVAQDADPAFDEVSCVNMGWASSIILRSTPRTVKSLHLTMANVDNLNSYTTINRLFMLSQPSLDDLTALHPQTVTKLCVTIQGLVGTHGDRSWHGTTGTAGQVRYWRKVLTSLKNITYLEFRSDLSDNEDLSYTDFEMTDLKGCVLNWLLPGLVLNQLCTLYFRDFTIPIGSFSMMFKVRWPRFKVLMLDNIQLMKVDDRFFGDPHEQLRHLQGESWVDACEAILEHYPQLHLEISQPSSNINDKEDYQLHSEYSERMRRIAGLKLNTDYSMSKFIRSPIEKLSEEDGSLLSPLPDVPVDLQ